jgi:hypothetical protein
MASHVACQVEPKAMLVTVQTAFVPLLAAHD